MQSRIKLFGHSVHQMLIVLPMGLLTASVVFNAIFLWTLDENWSRTAFEVMIPAGILTGLLAAPFGTIDWLAIPRGTRAKRVGALHGIVSLSVLVMFGYSLVLHDSAVDNAPLAVALTFLGGGFAVLTGWLGGELVDQLGVGVADHPHLNAPSSLEDRHAA